MALTANQMANLELLTPENRAAYDTLASQIEKSVREGSNRRGMYYSGGSTAEEMQQKAEALAQLLQQQQQQGNVQQQQQWQSGENERTRSAESDLAKKQMLAGGLTAGLGSLGTLGTLYYLNQKNNPGAAPATSGGYDASGKQISPFATEGRIGDYMKSEQSMLNPYQAGIGLAGGVGGYAAGKAAGGESAPGAAIGGALGYGLGSMGNPYMAGLGSLLGAFGGSFAPSRWFKF